MKISEQWLREYVNPAINTQALCHQLTMAGLEVGAIEPVAGEFTHVIVGEIVDAKQHPDADRLRVCQVNVGQAAPLQIVCGAPNARTGLKVAVAMIGALLPGDFKIKPAKLRGVDSCGMLCSHKELGLSEESDGIIELLLDAPVGQDIRDYLKLNDRTIQIELTPNRGDCLSVLGIAREVGLYNKLPVKALTVKETPVTHQTTFKVDVLEPAHCPRYLGRVIQNVNNNIETPLWMREYLRRCGVKRISPAVDVTNLVMLLTGQPMHAFDLSKLNGGIDVRKAKSNEKIQLLDGQTLTLQADTVVIADQQQANALAGIMGGKVSGVSNDTQTIFLECAYFAPDKIAGKPRQYATHSDSSHRFERGVDPAGMDQAMAFATQWICEITGGQAGPIVEKVAPEFLPKPKVIALTLSRVKRFLGIELPVEQITDIFTRLGFTVTAQGEQLSVTVPTYRFDMTHPEDLLEEVARVYGYDNIPASLPKASIEPVKQSEKHIPSIRFKQALVDRGYQEAMTYSFINPTHHQQFFPNDPAPTLLNPIASDMSVMRRSLLPGLLQSLQHNLNRQHTRVRLFESGVSFFMDNGKIEERQQLSGVIYGAIRPEQWARSRQSDFFDLKSDVQALLALAGLDDCQFVAEHSIGHLHPGQSAIIMRHGCNIGYLGALHPQFQHTWDLKQAAYVFELDLVAISQVELPVFAPISKFPSIRRDLAMVVDQTVSYAAIESAIKQVAGPLLQEVVMFDQFVGQALGEGKKSIAVGLILQDVSRTLKDEEVTAFMANIIQALQQKVGAHIRE
jgi:phenylalanyl-tRNA synthetase beta chain